MSRIAQYDPKKVLVIIGGAIMSGFSDGGLVTVARNEDAWTLQVGTDGEGTRSKTNNKSGRITVPLMQSSPSNDVLSALAIADELSNGGVVPILIKDSNGTTVCGAKAAWIVKIPDAEYGREAGPREWILESHEIDIFLGGEGEPEIQN